MRPHGCDKMRLSCYSTRGGSPAALPDRRMPRYRIHRITADHGAKFRAGAPSKPPYVLRRSHYEDGPEVEGSNAYELWSSLRDVDAASAAGMDRCLEVGDAIDSSEGLKICNYWGFDAASWHGDDS